MRKFVVEIDDSVYEQDISAEWLDQAVNVELDDCFSPHINVREVEDSDGDEAAFLLKLP